MDNRPGDPTEEKRYRIGGVTGPACAGVRRGGRFQLKHWRGFGRCFGLGGDRDQGSAVGDVEVDSEHLAEQVEDVARLSAGVEEFLQLRSNGDDVAELAAADAGGLVRANDLRSVADSVS